MKGSYRTQTTRKGQFLQDIQCKLLILGSLHIFFLMPSTSKIWTRTIIVLSAVCTQSRKRYLFFKYQSILCLAT